MLHLLQLELEVVDMNFDFKDRDGLTLMMQAQQNKNLLRLQTNIDLPNRVVMHLEKKTFNGRAKLVQLKLGGLKFNNECLNKLFVYHHQHGTNRSLDWIYDGQVEFEFFELTPIKYHLLMGTKILNF